MAISNDNVIGMDGAMMPWRDANVHVLTHTLHYGMGVFEGIRGYKTKKGAQIFRLEDHVDRLINSAKIFELTIPYTKEEITQAIIDVVKNNDLADCYIRPLVFLGAEKFFREESVSFSPKGNDVHIAIAAWDRGNYVADEKFTKGIRVKTSSYTRHHVNTSLVRAKAAGYYINSILANSEAVTDGYDEALMLDTEGFVSEGACENVFMVRKGILYTPDLASCLDGITRDSVIAIAQDLGIEVREKRLTRDEFYTADEAFFTGTAAEIIPIASLDNRAIGSNIGPITKQIQEVFFKAVRNTTGRYKSWNTVIK